MPPDQSGNSSPRDASPPPRGQAVTPPPRILSPESPGVHGEVPWSAAQRSTTPDSTASSLTSSERRALALKLLESPQPPSHPVQRRRQPRVWSGDGAAGMSATPGSRPDESMDLSAGSTPATAPGATPTARPVRGGGAAGEAEVAESLESALAVSSAELARTRVAREEYGAESNAAATNIQSHVRRRIR